MNSLSTTGLATSSASDIQMDYMKLLVTQMQNQNPLEPISNEQMASQLAQFSSLSQLETMNSTFAKVLTNAERTYANSLLGRNVTFFAKDEITGGLEQKVGRVDSVFNDPETNESILGVTVGQEPAIEEYTISLDAIILVE